MRIAVYVGKNAPTRSIYIFGEDIAASLRMYGHDSFVATKLGDIAKTDVVLNLLLESIGEIEGIRRFNGAGKQIVLVTAHPVEFTEHQLIAACSWLIELKFIVHSSYNYEALVQVLDAFAPMRKKAMKENLHLIWGGVTESFWSDGSNDVDQWMVPYNWWGGAEKNIVGHVETVKNVHLLLARSNNRFPKQKFYCMNESELARISAVCADDHYDCELQPEDRKDYMLNARKTGAFICTSKTESLGLMYLELLASGAVGLFLRRDWVEKLLPDYKLIADTPLELAVMARDVYQNYGRAHSYVKNTVQPFIRANRSHTAFMSMVVKLLETGSTK